MGVEPLVLAVDDETGILRLLRLELSAQGLRVIVAENGDEALRLSELQRPDVVVLDVMMPGMNGLEVMRRLRERTGIPIILLSARGHDEDRVRGLEMGADDYMVKPFNPSELAARIRAVLRRSVRPGVGADNVVCVGDVEIDLSRRIVKKAGATIALTRTEWMLLQHLTANAGKVLLNTELLSKVWGPEYVDDVQYLRIWISRVRSKLETDPSNPCLIKTLMGIGYLLDVHGDFAGASRHVAVAEAPVTGD